MPAWALIMAGPAAALGQFLAFTRAQESIGGPGGGHYLHDAGISGKGLLEFFGKLQNQEYRLAIYAKDSYDRTHPLSQERIAALERRFASDPAWNTPDRSGARGAVPAGQGQAARLSSNPKRAVAAISRERQERPGPLCPRLCLSSRRLSGQSAGRAEALLATRPDDPYFSN